MKKGWKIPFFNHIKIRQSTGVSYNFKAALDHSSRCRWMYFWCHDNHSEKKYIFNRKVEINFD